MTAAVQEKLIDKRNDFPLRMCLPVNGGAKIFKGTMVSLDAQGNANPAAPGLGPVIFVSRQLADNTAGTDGLITCDGETGVHKMNNSAAGDAITAADVGRVCYAADDSTVAKTSIGTRPPAGLIVGVEADGVLVWIGLFALPGIGDDIPPVQRVTGTLVAGVLTVAAGITVSASSYVGGFGVLVAGGTFSDGGFVCLAADRTVGGPGTGSVTVRALVQAGTANAADTSQIEFLIIG